MYFRFLNQCSDSTCSLVIANQTFIRDSNIRLYSNSNSNNDLDRPWDVAIFDEAQKMRNTGTKLFVHGAMISARSRFLLSGTPIQNSPSDLWALMHIAEKKVKFRKNETNVICLTSIFCISKSFK